MAKKKLTFFIDGEDTFIKDIIIGLRKDYDIKVFQNSSELEFYQMYRDCDIAWFEWCGNLAINGLASPRIGNTKNIVRLHSYEFFVDFPSKIDWNKVDALVTVNTFVADLLPKKFGMRSDIIKFLPNGVDMNKYRIPENKKYNKKVAYVGYLNYKKGPELLLHMFNALYKFDNKFEFHIAGQHQDERYAMYYYHLLQRLPFKVYFDDWQNDVSKYLEDKDYIISSSLFESFQYSIAEGMAQGLIPLIHHWPGAETIWPETYLYTTSDDLINIVNRFDRANTVQKTQMRNDCRELINRAYNLETQIENVKALIESL